MGRLRQTTEEIQNILDEAEGLRPIVEQNAEAMATLNGDGDGSVESRAEKKIKDNTDSTLSTTSENPVMNKVITEELGNKVDIVNGKGLSTNDYTNDDKARLQSVQNGEIETLERRSSGVVYITPSLFPELTDFDATGIHATYVEAGAAAHVKTLFLCEESTDGMNKLGKVFIGTYDHDSQTIDTIEIKEVPSIATQSEIDALFDSGTSGGSTSY